MMKIIADYQYCENYAAWDWDGAGQCPQGWKNKGGQEELLFDGLPVELALSEDIKEWATDLALTHVHYDDYSSMEFIGLSIVPSNQIDRYEAMDAEWHEDYEYLELFDTQEIRIPEDNDPIDRYDAMADELGFGGI
jgi:hypothetical protein